MAVVPRGKSAFSAHWLYPIRSVYFHIGKPPSFHLSLSLYLPEKQGNLPAAGEYDILEHTFGPKDVATFAKLSGDDNPIHLDDEYAARQVWIFACMDWWMGVRMDRCGWMDGWIV